MSRSDNRTESWQSLWSAILEQASQQVLASAENPSRELQAALAAIILARASWDSFANEFIEWRKLPAELKYLPFRKSINGLFKALDEPETTFEKTSIWGELLLVNDIRNALVHHKAEPAEAGTSPNSIVRRLQTRKIIAKVAIDRAWEGQVLCCAVARWTCEQVGHAIVSLETIPTKRTRALLHVQVLVESALKPIKSA